MQSPKSNRQKISQSANLSENDGIRRESSVASLTDQFFRRCLLSRYSNCGKENCSKLKKCEKKCENAQKAVAIVSSLLTEKEEKIKILEKKVIVYPSGISPNDIISSECITKEDQPLTADFGKF